MALIPKRAAGMLPLLLVLALPLTAATLGGDAEVVALSPAVGQALLDLAPGSTALVPDWPVAAGVRHEVELTRFDVYAPDARIVKMEGNRAVEVPRSRLAFFKGRSVDSPETWLVVSVDPDSRRVVKGVSLTPEGTRELRPAAKSLGGVAGGYLIAPPDQPEAGGEEPSWGCGQNSGPLSSSPLGTILGLEEQAATGTKAITSLHTATIAVDTDNELLSLKFSNNTTAATNYIANLIAQMNVMYERDFLIRLVQGFTILRPSTTADPYAQSGTGAADGAKLNEFSNYWAGGCGGACSGVSRALSMMLSGKQSSNNSASGIAWVNSLCSTSMGYSFSQVFKFAQDTSANDAALVGHELGHNFGSPHTHCYSPPIDTCYNGESCYTGGTSCPAPATYSGIPNVIGTVMSYCHVTGCGKSDVFHPRTVDLVAPLIQARVGTCIFPLGPANGIFNNSFESGVTPPWSGKTP
ncbi:MAG: M12 family metallo-peptidase [Thermoanaerobaculia bacterium]